MIEFHKDEKIILEQRKHWYIIATESFMFAIGAIAPLILIPIIAGYSSSFSSYFSSNLPLFIFFFSAWTLLMWVSFFVLWTNYYLDIIIVTDKRVIDIEQLGLFARDQAEVRLENIQDIKVEVIGIVESLLRLGNIHIQSAGQSREILAKGFPDPHIIKNTIVKAQDERLRKHRNERYAS